MRRNYKGGGRCALLLLLLPSPSSSLMPPAEYEQQRYDGWYNNLAHPAWGAVDAHLTRKTPPSYADGVYMMSGADRPSPRNLSQAFMKGADGLGSLMNRTAMQTFFGQVGRKIIIIITILIIIIIFILQLQLITFILSLTTTQRCTLFSVKAAIVNTLTF